MTAISRDEWLAAIEHARNEPPPNDPDAVTLAELEPVLGLARAAVSRHVKNLVTLGRAERTVKYVQSSDGRWMKVPAFRLVKPDGRSTP